MDQEIQQRYVESTRKFDEAIRKFGIVTSTVYVVLLVLSVLLNSGCGGEMVSYDSGLTNFQVNPDNTTSTGIKVDTSGYSVDLQSLGERLLKLKNCLVETRKMVANDDPRLQNCDFDPQRISAQYRTLTIKVVKPFWSKCSNWQFVGANESSDGPLLADPSGCKAKGLAEDPDCPCAWRSMVQGDAVITPPPDARSQSELPIPTKPVKNAPYLWDAGRVLTGCSSFIWFSPFSKCLAY